QIKQQRANEQNLQRKVIRPEPPNVAFRTRILIQNVLPLQRISGSEVLTRSSTHNNQNSMLQPVITKVNQ
ncbi:hypothetical protein TY91_08120, partial [Secundilactobacillus collinoides]